MTTSHKGIREPMKVGSVSLSLEQNSTKDTTNIRKTKNRSEAHDELHTEIRSNFSKLLIIANKKLYHSTMQYVEDFIRFGGVMEACPSKITGSPSVNLCIEPNGDVSILSTHDQIFSPPYCFVGASFPQSSVPHDALANASRSIGKAAFDNGICGAIGIDFVAFQKGKGTLKIWAVDLNIRYTPTMASFSLFHFLAGGRFNGSLGCYEVDPRAGVVLPPVQFSDAKVDDTKAKPDGAKLIRRCYVMNDYVHHPNLSSIRYSHFFNLCRQKSISFDLHERTGIAFNLLDEFSAGAIGILGVGQTLLESFKIVQSALHFIQREVGVYDSSSQDFSHDNQNFDDVVNAVNFVVSILTKKMKDKRK